MKIALLGAECTGKSSLATALVAHFNSARPAEQSAATPSSTESRPHAGLVTEALRTWCAHMGRTPQAHEQAGIALQQAQDIALAAGQLGQEGVLVADTTPLMTAIYSLHYFNDASLLPQALEVQRQFNHTLLMGLDLPWQADGIQRDGHHAQQAVDTLLRTVLNQAELPYRVIHGRGPARLEQALAVLRYAAPNTQTLCAEHASGDTTAFHSCAQCGNAWAERQLFSRLINAPAPQQRGQSARPQPHVKQAPMSHTNPDFRSPEFLRGHALHTMGFYHPNAVDPSGGFFHFLMDNGTVYDAHTRHLVSSTRLVYTHAMAWRTWRQEGHRQGLEHAFNFLKQAHRNPNTGGYAWVLQWRNAQATVDDDTNHAYGLAFVLLAHAHAHMAGLPQAHAGIAETFDLLEQHFWEPTHGLYADEADANWTLRPYRGQNANMHLCEALLAAFDATGETRYLERAQLLADHICIRQAALADGLVWEHYHANWQVDWDYNRHDSSNIFRPWGYQPGHLTEWAKLLLLLNERRPRADLLPRAQAFFDAAMAKAWDTEHGGLFYGFAPDGNICDAHKYFWVQAETLAAAARLAVAQQSAGQSELAERCWATYDRLWAYAWEHFVDHEHGAWWRILSADNRKLSAEKSPAGKVDYHTMGACHDVLAAMGHSVEQL